MVADGTTRDELEQRLRQQALLAEVGRRALAESDLGRLLSEASRLTALGLDSRFCKVLEYLPAENRLLLRAGVGWHDNLVGHATIDADLGSAAGYALHTGKSVISNSLNDERRFQTPGLLREHGVVRAVNVILGGGTHPFGVLEVDSDVPGVFSEHDVDFLQGMSNIIGLALERIRSHHRLSLLNENLEARVNREVAQRRQTEMALEQARKMEAIGQLTGGIAHDFNNFLLVIAGNLELAARSKAISGNPRLAGLIDTARTATTRGAQLTAQLLSFARRQPLHPEVRAINEMVSEFAVLASRILGSAVELKLELTSEGSNCLVDTAQFGSALLNLVVNARDAMPDGGSLTIRTEVSELTEGLRARHPGASADGHIAISVTDTGSGMPAEVLARALDPFFTTKEAGKGTGLGLSQVYGFVQRSGGFMEIESPAGAGCSVVLYLPASEGHAEESLESEVPKRGSATILVVEDDPAVRELVLLQLEDLGYRTLAAANGPEALAVLDRTPGPIDLLLTDMIMPEGISGVMLAKEALVRRPTLKAILSSGYITTDAEGVPGGAQPDGYGLPLLPKPYSLADLARIIEATLGTGPASASTADGTGN